MQPIHTCLTDEIMCGAGIEKNESGISGYRKHTREDRFSGLHIFDRSKIYTAGLGGGFVVIVVVVAAVIIVAIITAVVLLLIIPTVVAIVAARMWAFSDEVTNAAAVEAWLLRGWPGTLVMLLRGVLVTTVLIGVVGRTIRLLEGSALPTHWRHWDTEFLTSGAGHCKLELVRWRTG